MPVSVLGWWRTGLPSRPSQDRRRASGGARNKLAAPPAGAANQHPAEPPPPAPERSPDEEGSDAQEPGVGHATEKAVAPAAGRALGVAAVLSGARNWGFLLHAVGVHTANLAASLATRPLAPLQARMQAQLAGTEAVQAACRQLGVDSLSELQDLMNCVLLAEHVYKIVDHTTDVSVSLINSVKAQFPPHLTTLRTVQWAQPHVRHRYLLGESDDAVYVSFMGTKLPRDMATNANLFQEEVVLDAAMLSSGPSAEVGEGAGVAGGRTLAAHRGFLARAGSIPVQQLYQEARARGKRLVLCGHSLGGAVASLCAIRLLQHLPPNLHHTVSVYGFATPALGNEALQAAVREMGWHSRIRNYISPDDPIPKLLSFRRPPAEKPAGRAAPSEGSHRSTNAAADGAAGEAGDQLAALAAAAPPAAAAAVPSTGGATPAAAAVLSGANNIQSAPRLSAGLAAAGAQQRLGRIASHVAAGSRQAEAGLEATGQPQNRLLLQAPLPGVQGSAGLPRSSSAPAQLSDAAVAAVEEHTAAVAAANSGGGEAHAGTNGGSDGRHSGHGGPQHWLSQRLAEAAAPPLRRAGSAALAAAAPPMRAVVERAGSAARLVALPLSAAASVPMRAAPAYLPLGRQLYILPASVSSTEPAPGQAAAAPTAAPAAPPRRWPSLWRPQPAAAAGGGGSQDEDVEDNVDVAAAASLSAGLEGEEGAAAAAQQQQQERRKGVFHSHRMATYRSRLLGICQGALKGRLMVRSLPMLPTLPRPGDVVASELLAPPMFPLRAVATLAAPEVAAEAHVAQHGATPAHAHGSTHVQAAAAQAPAAPAQQQRQQAARPRGFRPLAFWGRLLARAAGEQRRRQEAPLELLVRVEGRGLANVTAAWIEGIPPAAPADVAPPGAAAGDAAAPPAPAPPAATVAEVRILEQPAAQALPPPLQGRPPLPVVGQLSAFVSWVAATLGWVALLRQLQPAGRSDYLLARVRLPAAAVRDAQRAAENSLLTSVTDGPLLHGLNLGPRLSLRLQSDFASHSVPLDIRVGADLSAQHAQRWQWPWRRERGAALPAPAQVHPLQQQRMRQHARQRRQPGKQQQQQQQQHGRWWWEWPGGTATSGH